MSYTWPTHYPPNCPPNPHTDKPDDYYRLVYKNSIRKRDFLSPYDRKKNTDLEKTNPCKRRSISLFKNIDDAKNICYQHQLFPYRFIAKIHLSGKHGIIHHTPENNNSHHDWWIPVGVDPTIYPVVNISGPYR